MRHSPRLLWPAAVLLALAPLSAGAHTGAEGTHHAHGFVQGLLHPLTGTDHFAVMMAVGLWSALIARRAWPDVLWAPFGFAAMLLAGAMAGLAGWQLPAVEPMIAVSLLVLGLLIATRQRAGGLVAAVLVGTFAVFHGVAHGQEMAVESSAWRMLAGMLIMTVALHLSGIALGWSLRDAQRWLSRGAGTAVSLFGLALLLA